MLQEDQIPNLQKQESVHGPGLVTVNFKSSRMTGIFLRNAYQLRPYAELKVTFPGTPREISVVREGEKFSTNRACYAMVDIPPKYPGLTYLRGPNDETTSTFDVNIPVMVYMAIDPDIIATIFYPRHSKLPGRRLYMPGVTRAPTSRYTSRNSRAGELWPSHLERPGC